jgi:uncharacterized protein (DUF983 family)
MSSPIALKIALWRGLNRKCPSCGQGKAFTSYLKVAEACPHCQTPLGLYPTDDGPAYITMLLVGHIVVAPLFFFEGLWKDHLEIIVPVTVVAIAALTLMILPFIKGAFLALLWHHGIKGRR